MRRLLRSLLPALLLPVAFAILAYQTVMDQCGNVRAVTGASHPALLGCIVPGGPGWMRRLKLSS